MYHPAWGRFLTFVKKKPEEPGRPRNDRTHDRVISDPVLAGDIRGKPLIGTFRISSWSDPFGVFRQRIDFPRKASFYSPGLKW